MRKLFLITIIVDAFVHLRKKTSIFKFLTIFFHQSGFIAEGQYYRNWLLILQIVITASLWRFLLKWSIESITKICNTEPILNGSRVVDGGSRSCERKGKLYVLKVWPKIIAGTVSSWSKDIIIFIFCIFFIQLKMIHCGYKKFFISF